MYCLIRTSPSRRHLFLGQMLLLGLFLSSAIGIAFVPNPSWVSCTIIRAGIGVCYCLIFATLLVKTVFLLSLHTGIYLPASYQALLLFFVIATQFAIDGQWLLHHTSNTVIDYVDAFGAVVYKCDHNISSLLLSLVYDIFLIGMSFDITFVVVINTSVFLFAFKLLKSFFAFSHKSNFFSSITQAFCLKKYLIC